MTDQHTCIKRFRELWGSDWALVITSTMDQGRLGYSVTATGKSVVLHTAPGKGSCIDDAIQKYANNVEVSLNPYFVLTEPTDSLLARLCLHKWDTIEVGGMRVSYWSGGAITYPDRDDVYYVAASREFNTECVTIVDGVPYANPLFYIRFNRIPNEDEIATAKEAVLTSLLVNWNKICPTKNS